MRLLHVRTTIAGALLALAFSACGSGDPTTAGSQTSQSGSAPKLDTRASDFTGSSADDQREIACRTNSPGCDDGEWITPKTEAASTPAPAPTQDEPLSPDHDAKRAVREAQSAIETYWTEHQTYAGADAPTLILIEPSLADGVAGSFKVTSTSQNGYALSATSGSGTTFRIERAASGAVRRDCSAPQTGDCPADGAW